ncbi:unnamed protein product [Meloidogyne enterolobii]|uniref:Uncharacterized protein n=1 Tax=Meloidogyne enterolobii TaxID=390850 RepID=A0ACB0YJN6_MELEN
MDNLTISTTNKNAGKQRDDDDTNKCVSSTLSFILDKICSSSELNTTIKSSNHLPLRFVVATENNQYLASDKNKQDLECSVPSNTPTACVASTAATICSFQSGSSKNSSLTTTKNININNSHQVTLRKMSIQPPPVARIAPKSAKPKLIPIHHQVVPSSNNENGKNITQQIPQATMSGISPYSLNTASTKALIQENKTTKTSSTIFSAPSVKINTSKLVEMSSNLGGSSSNNSSNSSSPIIIQTSINSQSSKNISTTTCGSLTTAPKIVFTLKPAPISSIVGSGGIMDNNNKSIRTTISSSSASPAITTPTSTTQIQPPPLCITPPKNNKKSPIKRPNQLIATTTTSNNSNSFEDSSKMSCSSSINSNQCSSSSPLLDSNDLLTNTVNKVASGADISPTNLEEGTSTKTLMSSTSTSSTTTNLPLTKPKQPKKKAPIKPKILVDEQRKNPVKIQPAVAVPCISPQIFGASPPQAQIASIPMESSVVADTTPTAAAICNSNGQQTFPSTGMLLPANSQFALASNGNLFSNYGTNFVIRQQPSSAVPIANVSGQQQQPQQQFVQLMPQQIFFSPVQQIDSSGQLIQQQQQTLEQSQQQQNQQQIQQGISSSPTKAVAPPQTLTTANLMTARNLFFHTGNGMFMPISNPNIIGIPQSQQPQQQTFLPITSTNLTPISSASSKFVVLASKPSGGTTPMPNILPKISSRGRTSTTTATIVSSITTNTTATPSLETTVSSTPSIQQSLVNNANIMLTNQQHGENIFYGNSSPHAQYLHQVFMLQQKQQQGNLYISNNNSVDVGEKKIELGKGGQQQTKPTRVRKKKGSGDTLTADNETQKHPKIPHFDGTIILHQQGQQHGQQQQGFDEEENEPPPVLCRGGEITSEPPSSGSGTKSIENVFQKEAKIIREKMFDSNGKKYGPLVHDIDGFKIEEDVEPFPCEHQKLLEKLVIDENVINQRKNKNDATTATTNENGNEEKEEKSLSTSNKNNSSSSAESNTSSNKSKKRQRKQSTSSSEGGVGKDNSSSFSKSPPNRKLKKMSSSKVEDKPAKQGRRRELENLLKMDFGPGKTPFQTSDPDEYAEEVLGGRKRTLALAAEEKSARKSLDRPGSSSKKHDKEKSFSLTSTTSATSNEKPDKSEPRRSDESLEEGCCSYCRRRFSEVGRDKEHEQYCSKECRRMKKYAKKQQQQQKAALLLNEGNNKASSSLIGNEKNASTTTSQEINNSATSKIRSSSIQSPPITNNNSSTPDANKTKTSTAKIMTSPLGSAFSTLQPQSIATNNTTILSNKWSGTTIPTTNMNEQIACLTKGFEVQSSSSSGDEQPQIPRPYGAPFNFLPTSLFASQFLPPQSQAFLSGQDSNNFPFLHSQSPPTQIPSQQLVMTPNTTINPFFTPQQQLSRQQNSHIFLQSPINTPTPTGSGGGNGGGGEKNVEIETLVAKSIFTWTVINFFKWYSEKGEKIFRIRKLKKNILKTRYHRERFGT